MSRSAGLLAGAMHMQSLIGVLVQQFKEAGGTGKNTTTIAVTKGDVLSWQQCQ